mmetsp:Transcript_6234/g.15517  ORF Transcript_6234/g.15517 Transcript_6234/m.15517 type:complete len:151 (-) Transcript_6234:270-722(-)
MGASFSIPFAHAKGKQSDDIDEPTVTAPELSTTTPTKKRSSSLKRSSKKQPKDATRRSRRIAKSDPPRVVFPTVPRSRTPSRLKFPMTPKSRRRREANTKPILRRKSPRRAKYGMISKVVKKGGAKKKYNIPSSRGRARIIYTGGRVRPL